MKSMSVNIYFVENYKRLMQLSVHACGDVCNLEELGQCITWRKAGKVANRK